MRHTRLAQIASVALVLPPEARMGSVGLVVDAFEMARSYIRRQYGAVDALPNADKFDVANVRLVGLGKIRPETEGGVPFPLTQRLDEVGADIVFVADCANEPNTEWDGAAAFRQWLRSRLAEGALLAASGNGIALLAEAGVLQGRGAAAPFAKMADWRKKWPDIRFGAFSGIVEDGGIITSRAGLDEVPLAVALVTAVTSANTGRWLAVQMGLPGTPLNAEGKPNDLLLVRAQDWLASRFSQKVTIEELARAMSVDRRTLHRHFVSGAGMSPIAYLQSLRIEAAKRMLERTPFAIDRIAALVGYEDTAFFRIAFRRATGDSPRRWRKRNDQILGGGNTPRA